MNGGGFNKNIKQLSLFSHFNLSSKYYAVKFPTDRPEILHTGISGISQTRARVSEYFFHAPKLCFGANCKGAR